MVIKEDKSLQNFEFWSGAKDLTDALSGAELDIVEGILEEQYPDGMDATELNDFFAYDGDTIADWLGYRKEEDILMKNDVKYLLKQVIEAMNEALTDLYPLLTLEDARQYLNQEGAKVPTLDEFLKTLEESFQAQRYTAKAEDIADYFLLNKSDISGLDDAIEVIKLEMIMEDMELLSEAGTDSKPKANLTLYRAIEMIDNASCFAAEYSISDWDKIHKICDDYLEDVYIEDREIEEEELDR